jgi:hypothetical protein
MISKIRNTNLGELSQTLHDLNIVPIASCISGFVQAKSIPAKAGHLYALASLITDAPPLQSILKLSHWFKPVEHFVGLCLKSTPSDSVTADEDPTEQQGAFFDKMLEKVTITFDPLSPPETAISGTGCDESSIKAFFETFPKLMMILTSILALICCLFGIHEKVSCDSLGGIIQAVSKVSGNLESSKKLWKNLTELANTILPVVYGFFGATYVSPECAKLQFMAQRINSLRDRAQRMYEGLRLDFFGVKIQSIVELEKQYDELHKDFLQACTHDKPLTNYRHIFDSIRKYIDDLREHIIETFKCSAGKQRPVAIWFCGRPGHGKTVAAQRIGRELARRDESSIYTRTFADKYWMNYKSQSVVIMDDLLQSKEMTEIHDFWTYTDDSARDVVGAFEGQKGFPFSSQYVLCTSNKIWICQPAPVQDYFAMNRRRDAVVYVHCPAVDDYYEQYKTFPIDKEWYEAHPPKFYLVDVAYGHGLKANAQENIKFSPEGPYVIREISERDLIEAAYNLQLQRKEHFREVLVHQKEVGAFNYCVPNTPIQYNREILNILRAHNDAPPIRPAAPPSESEISDSTDLQTNPVRRNISHTRNPQIGFVGVPGTGKDTLLHTLIPDAYQVTYEDGEILPNDRILYFEDCTKDPARLVACQRAIGKAYDTGDYRWVAFTANLDTQVWKDLPQEDKDMMMRRCHIFKFSFTRTFQLKAVMHGTNPVELSKKLGFSPNNISVKFSLHGGRDPEMYKMKEEYCSIAQIVALEEEKCATTYVTHKYLHLQLSMPEAPDIKIILDDPLKPSVSKMILAEREENGQYTIHSLTRYMRESMLVLELFNTFVNKRFVDRHLVAATLNEKQIKNTSRIRNGVIITPEWSMGFDTIDDILVMYYINQVRKTEFVATDSGYHIDGIFYPIEESYDKKVGAMVFRNVAGIAPLPDVLVPTAEEMAEQSTIIQTVKNVLSIIDIACVAGFSTAILFDAFVDKSKEEVDDTEEERRKMNRGPPPRGDKGPSPDWKAQQDPKDRLNYDWRDKTKYSAFEAALNEERRKMNRQPPPRGDKGPSPDHRTTPDPKTLTNWRYPGQPLYESRRFRKPPIADFEILTEEDWPEHKHDFPVRSTAYIAANGPVDYCDYGIVLDGEFIFPHEVSLGNWIIFSRPINSFREPLRKIPNAEYKNFPFSFKTEIGCPYRASPEVDFDHYWCSKRIFREHGKFFSDGHESINWDESTYILPSLWKLDQSDKTYFQGSYDQQALDNLRIIHKNQVDILESGSKVMNGIMLYGKVGITNAHAPEDFQIQRKGQNFEVEIISRRTENDVCLFKIKGNMESAPDIRKHIPTRNEIAGYLTRSGNNLAVAVGLSKPQLTIMMAPAEMKGRADSSKMDKGQIIYKMQIGYFGYTGVTEYGDCGSPIMAMAPTLNSKWVGIHSRGNNTKSIAVPISRELIDEMEQQVTVFESVPSLTVEHTEIMHTVPQRCERTGLLLIGIPKRKVFAPITTTKYKTGLDIDSGFEPSIKSMFDPRNLMRREVLDEGIARYGDRPPTDFKLEEVEEAAEAIGRYVGAMMVSRDMKTRILTNTEAINGPEKEEYPASKPIDRNGSVGYPYAQINPGRNTKGDYLHQNDKNLKWYFKSDPASQQILSGINRIVVNARNGVDMEIPWIAYSKDEPVKLKKIYDMQSLKTRVFFSGPADYQLAYRRYFGAALWRITELHLSIPIRVGINCLSLSWTDLGMSHAKVGKRGFASDMENWDGCVPLEFLQQIPKIYNIIYKLTDPLWTPQDDVARHALHKPVQGATVIVRDRVYKLDHAMASGYPGTAIDNSFINWMLFYCCWKRIVGSKDPCRGDFATFMRDTCLSVYGDDNLITIADPLLDIFHFNSFKEEARKFGFRVTDAAKTGKEVPNHQPLNELEFLKRTFKEDPIGYLPPLSLPSILKSLEWINGPQSYDLKRTYPYFRTITDKALVEQNLIATWPELAVHGKKIYDDAVDYIIRAARGTDIMINPPTFKEALRTTDFY